LYNAAISAGMKSDDITIAYSEPKALETAILDAKPGDLIVMFYEEFEQALEVIEKFKREIEQNELSSMETVAG
jgi:cyanophycin synthetase